jgi:hypothetical protein
VRRQGRGTMEEGSRRWRLESDLFQLLALEGTCVRACMWIRGVDEGAEDEARERASRDAGQASDTTASSDVCVRCSRCRRPSLLTCDA